MPDKKRDVGVVCKKDELIPLYATEKAAGADLRADLEQAIILLPGESVLIPTGLILEIPVGYEAQIRPRSGLALKHQITVLNTPGTIDADYRGQVGVILINHSKKPFTVEPLMKIAQLVLAPVYQANFQVKKELSTTQRGSGGFGHTGL